MNETLLTLAEMQTFNNRLAILTGGRLMVGPEPITRGQARALWAARKAFDSSPCSVDRALPRAPRSRLRKANRVGTGVIVSAAAALAGCTTLGGNVKGSFACRAPDGMCAPTSKIDDQALALIAGGDAEAVPATVINPYDRRDPQLSPTSASGTPMRSTEKVLRIVFPAHVDRFGRYREASAIHAVVERGTWMAAAQPRVTPQLGVTTRRAAQLAMVETAPSLAELAAGFPEVVFPQAAVEVASSASPVDPNAPDPAVVSAARRKGHAVRSRRVSVMRTSSVSRHSVSTLAAQQPQLASAVPVRATVPTLSQQLVAVQAAGTLPRPSSSPTIAPLPVSAAAYDLRNAGARSPLEAIRDQVGSILAAKATVRTASAAAKAGAPERPTTGPSILAVSGVEK